MNKVNVIKDDNFIFFNTVLKKYVGTSDFARIPEGTTRIDNKAFKNCTFLKKVEIPSSVNTIGRGAFEGCVSLEDVTIPKNVSHVENYAFAGCGILSVDFLGEVKYISLGCFKDCENLMTVTLPKGVIRIKEVAFFRCISLESVIIAGEKNTITHVEKSAFEKCNMLYELRVEKETEGVVFSDSLEYIGEQAFEECFSIKNINFGNKVRIIDNNAFYQCSSLSILFFPESLEYIGIQAFYKCKSLVEISFFCPLLEISMRAFESCKNLNKISFFADVQDIKPRAFLKCESIKRITICKYLKKLSKTNWEMIFDSAVISEVVFSEDYIGSELLKYIYKKPLETFEAILKSKRYDNLKFFLENATKLQDCVFDSMIEFAESKKDSEAVGLTVDIKNKIYPKERLDEIAKDEFEKDFGLKERTYDDWKKIFSFSKTADGIQISGYKSLKQKEVIIPSEICGVPVVSIKEKAFRGKDIVSVYIPESVKYIGESAFESCSCLMSANIPSGVVALRRKLFSGCVSLKDLKIASLPTAIERGVFFDCNPSQITNVDGSRYLKCGDNPYYALVFSSEKSRQEEEYIHKDTKIICGGAFGGHVSEKYHIYIPSGVIYIGEYAFSDALTNKLIIPDSVLEIASQAFYNCDNLRIVYLPASVKKYGRYVFSPINLYNLAVGVQKNTCGEKYVLEQGLRFFHYTKAE